MRILERILAAVGTVCEKNRPLHFFRPLWEATDAFFFSREEETPGPPHVRDAADLKRYMTVVILALAPATLGGIWLYGWRVLGMILVSYVVGGTVEVLFACIRRHEINEGFLVTGLLFPLTLPPTLPYWMVGLGIAFGVIFGKEVFGGTGRNLFNPALVGRCFLALAYPKAISTGYVLPKLRPFGRLGDYITSDMLDAVTSATPLLQVKQGMPVGWAEIWKSFVGLETGAAGETSALLLFIGGSFLLFTRVANWRVTLSCLTAAGVFSVVLRLYDPARFPPVLFQLFAGGLMMGAFFMATDPVTSPMTRSGKWIYGAMIGFFSILIRSFSGYPEGVMFAILLMNAAAPLLDEAVCACHFRALARVGTSRAEERARHA